MALLSQNNLQVQVSTKHLPSLSLQTAEERKKCEISSDSSGITRNSDREELVSSSAYKIRRGHFSKRFPTSSTWKTFHMIKMVELIRILKDLEEVFDMGVYHGLEHYRDAW